MPDKTPEEKKQYLYEIGREEALRAHDAETEFWKQSNQAAIDSGTLAIKTAFLINGGAAVAMLAFMGTIGGQGRISDGDLHILASCLIWFASGVAFAGISTAAAYFTNLYTAAGSSSRERIWDHPYLKPAKCKWVVLRLTFLSAAVLAGAISLSLFVYGMADVRHAVANIKIVAPLEKK